MSIVNLLPPNYRRQQSRRRIDAIYLLLFSVVMICVVAAGWTSRKSADNLRRINEDVTQAYRRAGESITEVQQLESRKKQVQEKARMAAELLERVPRSYLLATLTNALPDGANLIKISMKSSQPKPAASKEKAKSKFRTVRRDKPDKDEPVKRPPMKVSLKITGLAKTDEQVAEFIGAVRSSPLLRSVELVYSEEEEIDEEILRKFQITLELTPNAEVEIDAVDSGQATTRVVDIGRDSL